MRLKVGECKHIALVMWEGQNVGVYRTLETIWRNERGERVPGSTCRPALASSGRPAPVVHPRPRARVANVSEAEGILRLLFATLMLYTLSTCPHHHAHITTLTSIVCHMTATRKDEYERPSNTQYPRVVDGRRHIIPQQLQRAKERPEQARQPQA